MVKRLVNFFSTNTPLTLIFMFLDVVVMPKNLSPSDKFDKYSSHGVFWDIHQVKKSTKSMNDPLNKFCKSRCQFPWNHFSFHLKTTWLTTHHISITYSLIRWRFLNEYPFTQLYNIYTWTYHYTKPRPASSHSMNGMSNRMTFFT